MDNGLTAIRRHNGPRLYSFPWLMREKAEFIAEIGLCLRGTSLSRVGKNRNIFETCGFWP
ncbi:hypothetical protein C7U65_20025 [Bradyrhizobium sp. WBAH23]|nr:hypothetical protein [Bradyrhizobium sp. WBAH30]MDD1543821.1 hypothetical protein [Bradyrhizobium sp. WBAH41]MDD1557894.1 hypothetical protein [Bradyrhizobium sp. WBAH23]MDD1592202.1 hypothetical protein [Bradyrhizobium sp. WBAH42]NRB88419.1 hypothetical protein [Bradyrhizobium sp. WBAH10]